VPPLDNRTTGAGNAPVQSEGERSPAWFLEVSKSKEGGGEGGEEEEEEGQVETRSSKVGSSDSLTTSETRRRVQCNNLARRVSKRDGETTSA
jgi:hypothetical protein